MEGLATAYASSGPSGSDEDDEHETVPTSAKRPRQTSPHHEASHAADLLPPPPLDLLLPESSGSTDNVAAADGRVRQFAHVDGQYATHVYLPVRPGPQLADALLRSCAALGENGGRGSVHAVEPASYHISLSRTVSLSRAQIEGFSDALRLALRRCAAARAPVAETLCALANDTRTRHFAAAELRAGTPGHGAVCSMIDAVDDVLARYALPPFYPERRLHFSIAWSLEAMPEPLPTLQLPGSASGSGSPQHALLFDGVECRIGQRVTSHRLTG